MVFVCVLFAGVALFSTGETFAAAKTWTGGGSDDNMNTAANWAGDSAPQAGDDLVFPANISKRTIENNFTAGTSFNSITFNGTASGNSRYIINGNSMVLVAGINGAMIGEGSLHRINTPLTLNANQTITTTADTALRLGGVISGTGNITKEGDETLYLEAENTFSGSLTITAGEVRVQTPTGLGSSTTGTIVNNGAGLSFYEFDVSDYNATINEPITLNGSTYLDTGILRMTPCTPAICPESNTVTLAGSITLGTDVKIGMDVNTIITGAISGYYTIGVISGSSRTLTLNSSNNGSATPNGPVEAPAETIVITAGDDQPDVNIVVQFNQTYIIDGIRGTTSILQGGTLKGTGIVGKITVYAGGKLAPGTSPGCLTSSENVDLVTGSVFEVELGGTVVCSEYDQLIVSGTVTLGDSTLNLISLQGYQPRAGDKFIIINNTGSGAIEGTFKDLPEGSVVNINGVDFVISYKGGDGNDVELFSLPGGSNTGAANTKLPLLAMGALGVGVVTYGFVLSRKLLARLR